MKGPSCCCHISLHSYKSKLKIAFGGYTLRMPCIFSPSFSKHMDAFFSQYIFLVSILYHSFFHS